MDDLGHRVYVYTLAYPDGRVFYVGKGTGNRIDDHEQEAKSGVQSPKCDIIRAIWAGSGTILKTKVATFPSNEEALYFERYLISTLPNLANLAGGESRFGITTLSLADQKVFGASIWRMNEHGAVYWSARDMSNFLGYVSWAPFYAVVLRAESNLAKSGIDPAPHFQHTTLQITLGNDATRIIPDVRLSRLGFLMALTNADGTKAMVAYGKSYIAREALRLTHPAVARTLVVTSAEMIFLAHVPSQKLQVKALVGLRETGAAQGAGVVTARDFAVFQDHGYRGLYNGERARDIATRKGLTRGEHILDNMGSEELAANLFRATQAEAKITREGITAKEAANRAHHDVGAAVRNFIIDTLGGTPPEQLPTPAESIAQAQARERQALEQEQVSERQPSLFDALAPAEPRQP